MGLSVRSQFQIVRRAVVTHALEVSLHDVDIDQHSRGVQVGDFH